MIRLGYINRSLALNASYNESITSIVPLYAYIRRGFSRVPKKMRFLTKEAKEMTKMQTVNLKLDQIREDFSKLTPKGFKQLSDLAQLDTNTEEFKKTRMYRRFLPNKKQLNKLLRREFNKNIDDTVQSGYEAHKTEIAYDQLERSKENLRKIEEMKEFKKMQFKKAETNRLIGREKLKIENILEGDSQALNISYKQYNDNINELKNKRIDNFLNKFSTNNENKKLALLIQSGLMDKSVNINKLIENSLIALENERVQGRVLSNQAEFQQEIEHRNENTTDAPLNENNAGQSISNDIEFTGTNNELILNNTSEESQKFFELINRTDYDLEAGELIKVDFSKLNKFLNEFVLTSEDERYRLLENLRLVKEVRQYEELIFEKYRNQDITLRVKGKMRFEHLSEQENINYIKYNTEGYDEVLSIYDSVKPILTPAIASTLLQKITWFYLTSHSMKEDYDIRMLQILKDNRYKALIRYLVNNLQHLSNKDFSVLVWSLGKLHNKEKGLIHYDLFEVLQNKIIIQVVILCLYNNSPLRWKID